MCYFSLFHNSFMIKRTKMFENRLELWGYVNLFTYKNTSQIKK